MQGKGIKAPIPQILPYDNTTGGGHRKLAFHQPYLAVVRHWTGTMLLIYRQVDGGTSDFHQVGSITRQWNRLRLTTTTLGSQL